MVIIQPEFMELFLFYLITFSGQLNIAMVQWCKLGGFLFKELLKKKSGTTAPVHQSYEKTNCQMNL